jgi:hypothetical protein
MSVHIQKIRVPIRLAQPNRDPRDGWFLLFPNLEHSDQPETVFELLNSSRTVIPFIQAEDSSVVLLTRANIDWVAIGTGVTPDLVVPGPPPNHQQRVQIRFVDEQRVDAVIEWRGDRDRVRLSDFLNWDEPFLVAKTGFGTLIVNKLRIRETRITSSVPGTPDAPQQPASPAQRAAP